jgi:addiction module HigA family antidote
MTKLDPITPGEILLEEFLIPMGLSQYRLAKEIGVPAQRISEIVAGKRSITADTDLRLCRFFGLSNGYWLIRPNMPLEGVRITFGLHRKLRTHTPSSIIVKHKLGCEL